MLFVRAEQAESIAAVAQAENLPPWVKPTITYSFKVQMDNETIFNFLY